MAELRVLIVGADDAARAGLVAALESQPYVRPLATDDTDADPADLIETAEPDVVLVDADATPEGARRLLGPGEQAVPVVVLTARPHAGAAALAAGARAVVRRDADPQVLVAALAAAASGLVAFDPAVADSRAAADRSEDRVVEELTPREGEVLALMAEGLTNRQIAGRLGVSDHTVKFHVDTILGKLGAHSRTEAVTRAARAGLIIL